VVHIIITPVNVVASADETTPRLAGSFITVHHVIGHLDSSLSGRGSLSLEEMEESFNLRPAEVHAALSYYLDHKVEINDLIDKQDRVWNELTEQKRSK